MTPCARGCCWTPFSCASTRTCACHWEDRKPAPRGSDARRHADPTANEAIKNVMKERKRK